ncbi:hypothetical protein QL285_058534 [Trifolium repens]|nr:hypothetical protein QL285_058534 [Trifolium repens]
MSEITYGLPTPMPHVCNPVVLLILFLHGQIQFSRVRPPINTFASSTAVPYLDKTDFRRLQNDSAISGVAVDAVVGEGVNLSGSSNIIDLGETQPMNCAMRLGAALYVIGRMGMLKTGSQIGYNMKVLSMNWPKCLKGMC